MDAKFPSLPQDASIREPALPCKPRRELGDNIQTVYVKTLEGKTVQVDSPGPSVSHLHAQIQDKEGIPPKQQHLVYAGRKLDNQRLTLSDYDVKEGGTLHLRLYLMGN